MILEKVQFLFTFTLSAYNKFPKQSIKFTYSAESSEHKNGENIEQTENGVKMVNQQDPLVTVSDHGKLLISVFSLLQNLGADERPEVISFLYHSGVKILIPF